MKIVIYGSGGIGGYFGAKLAAAGEDVHFIARGPHLEAMQSTGLRVKRPSGDLHLPTVQATDDAATIGAADLVIVAVKLYDSDAAAEACKALTGPETAVLTLQNGVTSIDAFSAALGPEHVLGGCAYIMTVIEEPGIILQTGSMEKIVFGEPAGGTSDRAQGIYDALDKAGIPTELSQDIVSELWTKFTYLAPLSGVTALTRNTIGPIRDDPEVLAMFMTAVDEVRAVAKAKGIALPDDIVEVITERIHSHPPDNGSSMLYDLTHGKRLELPWLSGAVVRLGQEVGVETPTHAFIYKALKLFIDGPKP